MSRACQHCDCQLPVFAFQAANTNVGLEQLANKVASLRKRLISSLIDGALLGSLNTKLHGIQ